MMVQTLQRTKWCFGSSCQEVVKLQSDKKKKRKREFFFARICVVCFNVLFVCRRISLERSFG